MKLVEIKNLIKLYGVTNEYAELNSEETSELLFDKINGSSPFMVARFGYTELYCLLAYLGRVLPITPKNSLLRLIRRLPPRGFNKTIYHEMEFQSGFINANIETLSAFAELMLQSTESVDVLGSWLKEEIFIKSRLQHVIKVKLFDLEPFFYKTKPWTYALRGKRVLVIHPFEDSIISQYAKRHVLFKDLRILPDFNLITIKAVQSVAGSKSEFSDWFDALKYMKNEIQKVDFDIAIIGCGAYGFPLASYIKELGKKAIHLGGATQLLFGIMGKRWEDRQYVLNLKNENWIYPSTRERPPLFNKHDGAGSYWQ